MACGRIVEDVEVGLEVVPVPVTVLVVGATMIVVGSHDAVLESVAVGKRLVPKVSDDDALEVNVGVTMVSVELVGTGGEIEVDSVDTIDEVKLDSVAVLVGGRVTVLSKLDVEVGGSTSESVELAVAVLPV